MGNIKLKRLKNIFTSLGNQCSQDAAINLILSPSFQTERKWLFKKGEFRSYPVIKAGYLQNPRIHRKNSGQPPVFHHVITTPPVLISDLENASICF